MDHLKVYEAARDYLRDPEHWCQGKLEDGRGGRCVSGAIWRASQENGMGHLDCLEVIRGLCPIVRRLDPMIPFAGPATFNDEHTHAEVLELLNIAIAELQAERRKEAEAPCPIAA